MRGATTPTMSRHRMSNAVPSSAVKTPSRASSLAPQNLAGSARRSSFFKPSTVVTDARNYQSKEYQARAMKKVHSFLIENCEMSELSERVVRSPTQRDFITMFETIYQFFDPNYKMTGKVEEEVPRIFAALMYPFPIKPSSLKTIGASHSWPAVLAALEWLVGLAEMSQMVKPSDILLNGASCANTQNTTITYLFKQNAFREYVNRGCQFDDATLNLHLKRYRMHLRDAAQVEDRLKELNAANAALRDEIEKVKQQAGTEEQLRRETVALQTDIRSQKTYLEEMTHASEQYLRAEEDAVKLLRTAEANVDELTEQIAKNEKLLAEQFERHSLEPAAARALQTDVSQIWMQVNNLRVELEKLSQSVWSNKQGSNGQFSALNTEFQAWFRRVADLKKGIPSEDGSTNQMEVADPTDPKQLHSLITEQAYKLLVDTRRVIESAIREAAERMDGTYRDIARAAEMKDSLDKKIDARNKENMCAERERARERQEWHRKHAALSRDLESLRINREQLSTKKSELSNLESDLVDLLAEKRKVEFATHQYVENYGLRVLDALVPIVTAVENAKSEREAVERLVGTLVKATKELDEESGVHNKA